MERMKLLTLSLILILTFSLFIISFEAKAETEPLILAYYYVWYNPDNPDHDWEGDSIYTPLLGYYWSNDTQVIDQHLAWALKYGIDGFIVSWWGKYPLDNFEDQTAKKVFERASVLYPEFKLAIMIERITYDDGTNFYEWKEFNHDFDNQTYTNALDETLIYVVQNFIQPYEDVYLKWEGKPVIVLYAFLDQDHLYDETFYLHYFNERIKYVYEQTGIKISLWSLNTLDAYCFDVVAMYLPKLQAEDNPQSPMRTQNYETVKGVKVSSIFAGYHKVDSDLPIIERENGEFYRKQWENALSFNPDIIFIVSFNEWHESTSIEPSEEWKYMYLEITANPPKPNSDNLGENLTTLFVSLIVVFSLLAIVRRIR